LFVKNEKILEDTDKFMKELKDEKAKKEIQMLYEAAEKDKTYADVITASNK